MKLQELLISSGYDEPNIYERVTDEYKHALVTYKNHKRNTVSISLSYLLLSTPFLSLLERKKVEGNMSWVRQDDKGKIKNIYYDDRYHKINLVLLNTDAERIEYIEHFTL